MDVKVKGRLVLLAGAAAAVASAPLWGPPALARLDWFGVTRVEISGTRLLAPHDVLAASRVGRERNVWDPTEPVEAALRRHPVIAGATVTRKLPGTLRIRVEEKLPIAYVEAEVLSPITAAGEILPVDPARARVDLPIIRGGWAATEAAWKRRLLAETDRLRRADPALLAQVSEIRRAPGKADVLLLAHPLGEILVPVGAQPERLAQLRAVLAELDRRLPADSAGASGAARIDLRYGDQIVVRLPSSV